MNKKSFIVKGLTFALGSMLFAACNMVDNPVVPTPGGGDEPVIEPVDETYAIIGSEDNTTPFWSAFSQDYKLQKNQALHLQFVNYTNQAENWDNWLAGITNDVDRNDTANGYVEYAILRADNWGWGTTYNGEFNESAWNWDTFKQDMNGATVDLTVARYDKHIQVLAEVLTAAGQTYEQAYTLYSNTADEVIRVFLLVEGGHLVIDNTKTEIIESPISVPALEGLIPVGKANVWVEQEAASEWNPSSFEVDVQNIANKLGCEVSALTLNAVNEEQAFAGSTANNGGFWYNQDGNVTSWGNNTAFYIEPLEAGNFAAMNIGQFPGFFKGGDNAETTLFFVNGEKYYVVDVHLTVVEPKQLDVTLESVGEATLTFEQAVSGYEWSEGVAIPTDQIAEAIGTTEGVLYGLAVLDENGNEPEGNAKYVKNYTMDPAPGFWFNKDGRNSGWGEGVSAIGMSIAVTDGMVQMIQMPGVCAAGETYNAKVFFVNEETGKMFTLNLVLNVK